jgi:hypothetical protein
MLLLTGFFTLLMTVMALPLFVGPVYAGQCLEDTRKVQLDGKKIVRFRNYLCRADQSNAQVSVEFHRLSDIMASALLANALPASLQRVFGNGTMVKNQVHKEFSLLLDKFGTSLENMQINYQVNTAGTKDEAYGYDTAKAGAGTRSLEFNFYIDMPLVDDIRHVNEKTTWPKGYKFLYSPSDLATVKPEEIVRGTTLWRYAVRDDLDNFERNWHQYTARVKKDAKHPKHDFGDFYLKVPKYIKLLQHVTKQNLPKGFLIITGGVPFSCGDDDPYAEFSLSTRSILFDVAVIKNRSRHTITVDSLLGSLNENKSLRPMARSKLLYTRAATLFGGPYKIKAGGSLIVPMNITFTGSQFNSCSDKNCKKDQRKIYKHIRSQPAGTSFKAGRIVKTQKSFKKPKFPRNSIAQKYVYGPEVALAGLSIAGEHIKLKDHSANFLQLTAGADVGSCPYLYALDGKTGRWRGYGKVIHTADSKAKKMTQLVKLDGFANHFRLTEHELELSYIDRVQLVLDLHDGRKINLSPQQEIMSRTDGNAQKIYAGQTVEFDFTLPDELAPKDIKNSSLTITGYYQRYGSMIMSAR